MATIQVSPNGNIDIDGCIYTAGSLWVRPNGNRTQAAITNLDGRKDDIVSMQPITSYSGSGGAFVDFNDMISDLDTFFFNKAGNVIANGRVDNRNALPITVPPNAGNVFFVDNPVSATVLGIPYKTFQAGLYIRDTENGNLNDWRPLPFKVQFTDTEFGIVDADDTGRKVTFDAGLITSGTPVVNTWQNKSGIVAHLDDISQGIGDLTPNYRTTTNSQSSPPINAGRIKYNAVNQVDSTQIFFSKIDDDGNTIDGLLLNVVEPGAPLIIVNRTNINLFQHFNINSVADTGTEVTYGVDFISGTHQFSNNDRVIAGFGTGDEGADEFPHIIKVDPIFKVKTGEQYDNIPDAVTFANAAASPSTPYLIILGAAVHPLDAAIALQANVHMIGGEASSTIIQVDDTLAGLVIIDLQASNSLRKITILGSATLKSTAGTYAVSSTTEGSYFLEDVTIDFFNRGISFTHTSSGGSFQVLQVINHARIRDSFIGMFISNNAEIVLEYANFVECDTHVSYNGAANLTYNNGRVVSRTGGTGIGFNMIGSGTVELNSVIIQDLAEGISFNGIGKTILNSTEFRDCTIETTFNAVADVIANNVTVIRSKLVFNVNPSIEGQFTSIQPGLREIFFATSLAVGLSNKPLNFSAGEGGAYLQGMLVYTEDTGNTFINVTDAAISPTGSTFTFPGTAANNHIYISTNVDDALDFLQFFGIVLNLQSIADYGAGSIELQYFNGTSFVTVAMMGRDNGTPHLSLGELVFGDSTRLSRDVFFNSRMEIDWAKNDPPTTGVNRFWIRFSITTAITTVPQIEQILINPDHFNVKGNGFPTFHGHARHLKELPIQVNDFRSAGVSPLNQDLFRSDTVNTGHEENSFQNGVTDRNGTKKSLPDDIDTSIPILLTWSIASENSSGGNIRWVIRIDKSNDTDNRDVFFSTAAAPTSTATQQDFVLITPAPTADALQLSYSIELPINTFIPRRLDEEGDLFWLNIERTGGDGADTHTADVNMIKIRLQYTSWATGGFDTNIQFALTVPVITSPLPPTETIENQLFEHQATATGGGIIWSLNNEPSGMTISIQGLITWIPTIVGTNINIDIIATNIFGSDTQQFDIEVTTDPISQAQLIGHFRAHDLTLNDLDPVANWIDQSPLGANMTQGTGSSQPTFMLNQVNALPAVSGDGGDTMHNFQVNIPPHTTFGNTIIIVAATTQGTQAGMVSQQSQGGSGNQTFFYINRFTTGRFIASFDSSTSNNNSSDEVTGSYNDGAFHIFTGSHNATDTFLRVDTTNTNTYSESVSPFTIEDMHLFNNGSGAGSFFFNGLIAEAIFWNRQLPSGEIDTAESFLKIKYNIA